MHCTLYSTLPRCLAASLTVPAFYHLSSFLIVVLLCELKLPKKAGRSWKQSLSWKQKDLFAGNKELETTNKPNSN